VTGPNKRSGLFIASVLVVFLSCVACTPTQEQKAKPTLPPRVIYDLGTRQLQLGEYFQARLSLEQAVTLDPNNAIYRNSLGLANLHLGRLGEAADSFREALRLNPQFPDAYNNLGVALAQSGKSEEALRAFRKALSFPSYNSPEIVYQNLGETYYKLGRYEEAERALRTALRLNANLATSYYTLGLVHERQARRQDALKAYREVLIRAPDTEVARKAQERVVSLGG